MRETEREKETFSKIIQAAWLFEHGRANETSLTSDRET